MRSTTKRVSIRKQLWVLERDKFGRITWEKLSESNRFANIARVKRPQDAWSDFFWEDQQIQKVD